MFVYAWQEVQLSELAQQLKVSEEQVSESSRVRQELERKCVTLEEALEQRGQEIERFSKRESELTVRDYDILL